MDFGLCLWWAREIVLLFFFEKSPESIRISRGDCGWRTSREACTRIYTSRVYSSTRLVPLIFSPLALACSRFFATVCACMCMCRALGTESKQSYMQIDMAGCWRARIYRMSAGHFSALWIFRKRFFFSGFWKLRLCGSVTFRSNT